MSSVTCSIVLKPYLRHSLAQSCRVSDTVEFLSVRVGFKVIVSLQHLQLLFAEDGTRSLRVMLMPSRPPFTAADYPYRRENISCKFTANKATTKER